MPNLTAQAKNRLGPFVHDATTTTLTVHVRNIFGEADTIIITPDDLAEYMDHANGHDTGDRTFAGFDGDWKTIDHLAATALEWFRAVNRSGLRSAFQQRGLEPILEQVVQDRQP